jgi:hypothetical protein
MNIQRIEIKQNGMFLNSFYQGKFFSVCTEGETRLIAIKRLLTKVINHHNTKK